MSLREHAKHNLNLSRRISQTLVNAMKSDDDWMYQAHDKANHPLWIVGHLGLADNLFISRFRPELEHKPEGWDELFWFGTEPLADRAAYPPTQDVIDYFTERRETLFKVLEDLSEDELNAEAPPTDERHPAAGAPSIGFLFLFAAYHEGMHTGQFTIAHRGLGHPPLFQPQSETASEGV